MKTCFKCGIEKPALEFYTHHCMADGLLGKCKDCTKLDVLAHRLANIETVRAYDRQRATLPHRVENASRVAKAWDLKYPERAKAQNEAGHAVRDGKLRKPSVCEGCGLPKRLEKHHHDYSLPLSVAWLCKPCHAIADKIRRLSEVS